MSAADTLSMLAANAVAAMTPLVFAALGGLFTELTGTLNIAMEGLMLTGAFFGFAVAAAFRSLALGVLAGALAGAVLAFIFGYLTIRLRANIFITGLAVNIFAGGAASLLSWKLFGTRSVVAMDIARVPRPFGGAAGIPILGPILMSHDAFAYGSWIFAILCWVILRLTPFGMRVRAVGSRPEAARAAGFEPDRYRLAAIVFSGISCGIAGAGLSLPLGAYVPNISSGRGWIALVAIYLGARKPARVVLACFVFALAESFSNYAQGIFSVPSDFILAIPYAVTLAALVAGSVMDRKRPVR